MRTLAQIYYHEDTTAQDEPVSALDIAKNHAAQYGQAVSLGLAVAIEAYARAQNATLRAIILDLTPPCRTPGDCWCPHYHDVETRGHLIMCVKARAALEGETG